MGEKNEKRFFFASTKRAHDIRMHVYLVFLITGTFSLLTMSDLDGEDEVSHLLCIKNVNTRSRFKIYIQCFFPLFQFQDAQENIAA